MFRTLLLTLTLTSLAAGVTIDFEGLPASNSVSGPPDNPLSVLTDQFSPLGVVFGRAGFSAGVSVVNIIHATSGMQSIIGLNPAGEPFGFAASDIYFSFVVPGTLSPATTDFVSFQVGDSCCDLDEFSIRAYGLANNLLDTQLVSGTSFQLYTLNLPGVHRIWVDFDPANEGANSGFFLDDLTFNDPTAVPEPTTFLVSAAGLLLLALRRGKAGLRLRPHANPHHS